MSKSSSAVGGINLQGTLDQQEPLQIDSKGQLQTTKEHWRWENYKMSLEKKGLYEAPGNLLWLSMDKPTWDGEGLPATDITWGQVVAAGGQLRSDEKFLRSSDNEQKRQNGSIPTAVTSAVDLPTKLDPDLVKNVAKYLQRSADAAKLMLPKSGSAVGDIFTGENDSDAEDY